MITRLALRGLLDRPWRSALLLGGFGLGVGVMITLLAIGEAMVTQSRDEKLVGGGTVTVLPEGMDIEAGKINCPAILLLRPTCTTPLL